jgi:THAP domain
MPICSVFDCKTGSKSKSYIPIKGVKLHRFPKDENLLKIWADFCENPKILNVKNGKFLS